MKITSALGKYAALPLCILLGCASQKDGESTCVEHTDCGTGTVCFESACVAGEVEVTNSVIDYIQLPTTSDELKMFDFDGDGNAENALIEALNSLVPAMAGSVSGIEGFANRVLFVTPI